MSNLFIEFLGKVGSHAISVVDFAKIMEDGITDAKDTADNAHDNIEGVSSKENLSDFPTRTGSEFVECRRCSDCLCNLAVLIS
jgi:hypothetical protein